MEELIRAAMRFFEENHIERGIEALWGESFRNWVQTNASNLWDWLQDTWDSIDWDSVLEAIGSIFS